MAAALDSQLDGFAGTTMTGLPFTIVDTAASDRQLCRVVSVESPTRFDVDTYCKSPGGSWS
ncbi:hypothetical protein [Loktanella sp. 3ANDIMAR09]|uniref:hypothetical protein n=1 Tax=Loktanella sp. 3ANDIMAR09 TaxID=1225657 RepID=UPI0012EDB79A|nr:hypothetical protein [Loktanella sp. 3ANDIMAR09]